METPRNRAGTLESHWKIGPWVNATSRPTQIPRESLKTSSRCQLSSVRLGSRTTVGTRGESHTGSMEAITNNSKTSRSQCPASHERRRSEPESSACGRPRLANSSSCAMGEYHSMAGQHDGGLGAIFEPL